MYGKIFASLWHGSLLGKADAQLTLILLICHADREGNCEAHPAEIATWTGLELERVDAALELLQADDPDSRSDAEGGKRVTRAGLNLWHITNYKTYLAMQDREIVREQTKARVRKHRAKAPVTPGKRPVTVGNGPKRQGEGEGEGEKDSPLPSPPHPSPRSSPGGNAGVSDDGFEQLWRAYPHYGARSRKAQARTYWRRLRPRPELAEVMAGLERCRRSDDWTRESGRFIPGMHAWVLRCGWDSSDGTEAGAAPDSIWEQARRAETKGAAS